MTTVKAFLDSKPPAVQGDPKVVMADGVESKITITFDGAEQTFKAYYPSDTGHTPETSTLIRTMMQAGNFASTAIPRPGRPARGRRGNAASLTDVAPAPVAR